MLELGMLHYGVESGHGNEIVSSNLDVRALAALKIDGELKAVVHLFVGDVVANAVYALDVPTENH